MQLLVVAAAHRCSQSDVQLSGWESRVTVRNVAWAWRLKYFSLQTFHTYFQLFYIRGCLLSFVFCLFLITSAGWGDRFLHVPKRRRTQQQERGGVSPGSSSPISSDCGPVIGACVLFWLHSYLCRLTAFVLNLINRKCSFIWTAGLSPSLRTIFFQCVVFKLDYWKREKIWKFFHFRSWNTF